MPRNHLSEGSRELLRQQENRGAGDLTTEVAFTLEWEGMAPANSKSKQRGAIERQNSSPTKNVHILILGTCDCYVTRQGGINVADGIKGANQLALKIKRLSWII